MLTEDLDTPAWLELASHPANSANADQGDVRRSACGHWIGRPVVAIGGAPLPDGRNEHGKPNAPTFPLAPLHQTPSYHRSLTPQVQSRLP